MEKKRLFIGSFIENNRSDEVWKNSKTGLVFSGDLFQKSLLNGFNNYPHFIDYIINAPSIGSFPLRYKKMYFPISHFEFGSIDGVNCGFMNFTYFKKYDIYLSIKRKALVWAKKNINNERTIILYSLLEPYLKAAIAVKNKYPDTHICCIVLDLPEFFNDSKSLLSGYLSKRANKRINYLTPNIDSFILLTEHMANALNIQGVKPWILIEGIYLPRSRNSVEKEKKTILYTGKLDRRFGITEMIDAFISIPDKDYRLWICGDGSDRIEVEKAVKQDNRIIYFGVVKQEQVLDMQTKATLLINPRKGDDEYTKYSFPSKTMEYMASGTPTVMYKLQGIPEEYNNYLIIVPENKKETLKNTLMKWCSKDQMELDQFGEYAKKFILNKKTATIQSGKIVDFLNLIRK